MHNLNEEINRIKLLFGESLLYGNINNNFQILNEQVGRFFKKVLDDFKTRNPISYKSFDDISLRNFAETDMKSLDDVFKHVDDHAAIWKSIGLTDQDIKRIQTFKKKIITENKPNILFSETSTPGVYFFDLIPLEGGLRGEVFYWFSKKYPNEWSEGLRSLSKNADVQDKIKVKGLDGVDVNVTPDLPIVRPKVKVDANGKPVQFNSSGKPVDVDGKEVKLLDDGKVDTNSYEIEVRKKSTTPIKVDETGKPMDFDSNGRPIDTEGKPIDTDGNGTPIDPDQPRVDEDFNPRDNNGNPMDEAGRIRDVQRQRYTTLQQLWQLIKKYFFSKAILFERIAEIIRGNKNLEKALIDNFNLDLKNALEARINNFNAGGLLNANALRRKVFESFLELQRISQRKLSGEVLDKIEANALDSYLADIPVTDMDLRALRRDEIKGFFKSLREGEDGLQDLFKLMDEDAKVEDPLQAGWKTMGEFWGLANWPGWNKDVAWYKNVLKYIGYPIRQFGYRLFRNFLNHSPWKNIEFQRILLRGNYSTGSVIVRQMFSLFLTNIVSPIIKGYAIFFFYADDKPFGGLRRMLQGQTDYQISETDEIDIWKDYISPELGKSVYDFPGEEGVVLKYFISPILQMTPTDIDDFIKSFIQVNIAAENPKKGTKVIENPVKKNSVENLKNQQFIKDQDYNRQITAANTIEEFKDRLIGNISRKYNYDIPDDIKEAAKKLNSLLRIPNEEKDIIDTYQKALKYEKDKIGSDKPYFEIFNVGKRFVEILDDDVSFYVSGGGVSRTPILAFIQKYKTNILNQPELAGEAQSRKELDSLKQKSVETFLEKINKAKEKTGLPENKFISSLYKKIIMENTPRTKFGEDNFKHWKDTFVFKSEDEKNPGQFKQVKINMEDVMDRINHYRKKYDEDDAFVRAVLDTHDNVVKVMYTKDLADISESARPRGLALVLRENRGELEIFSVSRPANGNWFLVKGDYTPSQLANMDLEKKEPEDKEPKKLSKTEDDLKKKEEESITLLKRNEKEGLLDLPRKVKQKLKEKISKGWTTEEPPSYLMDFYTTSEVNSVFNDPIEIFKLDPSPSYFATIVKNSARVIPKRGFCRSLYMASRNEELNERQQKTISHILTRCKAKLAGKFGVASF